MNKKTCLLYFSASWCGPCRVFKPTIESVVESTGVDLTFVDIEESEDLVNRYSIQSVPTVLAVKDGVEVDRITGIKNLVEVTEFVNDNISRNIDAD